MGSTEGLVKQLGVTKPISMAGPSVVDLQKTRELEKEDLRKIIKVNKPLKTPFGRLLKLAAHALAEGQNKPKPKGLWEEPYDRASNWKPCAF